MNLYKKLTAKLVEGAAKGEQRGRAHLSQLPNPKSTRHLGRGQGGHYDPDEGSKEDVQQHQTRTNAERLAMLRSAEKTATGIQLAKIKSFIDRISSDSETKSLKAHKEIDMAGYERILEAMNKQLSRDYAGHEERIKAHIARIQNDPRFEAPSEEEKAKGRKGAEASNKSQGEKKKSSK